MRMLFRVYDPAATARSRARSSPSLRGVVFQTYGMIHSSLKFEKELHSLGLSKFEDSAIDIATATGGAV